jgi:hypothetical protein
MAGADVLVGGIVPVAIEGGVRVGRVVEVAGTWVGTSVGAVPMGAGVPHPDRVTAIAAASKPSLRFIYRAIFPSCYIEQHMPLTIQ